MEHGYVSWEKHTWVNPHVHCYLCEGFDHAAIPDSLQKLALTSLAISKGSEIDPAVAKEKRSIFQNTHTHPCKINSPFSDFTNILTHPIMYSWLYSSLTQKGRAHMIGQFC